ncbi:hypothetical protein B9Z19DRAFT_1010078 [Tuber borchii]|uniref:Crinkler (CRN) family protein n=1 Tax=Tuber borchii TaxID=42251 RepID=A0A2T6ZAA2_TUBBO|nr:hypothetical protein B9Z19DRAFT_1010078 [Tuber borchii]
MENLYDELWGRDSSRYVIENRILVPRPQQGVQPGYKIPLDQAFPDGLPLLDYPEMSEEPFRMMVIASRVPVGKQVFLVRREYDELLSKLEETEQKRFSNTGNLRDGVPLDYQVGGQPGCGKSMFLLYLLATRLLQRKPTVYRRNDGRCFYFDETHKGVKLSAQDLFDMADKQNERIWILTDAPLEDESWGTEDYEWFIVLAVSPTLAKKSSVWEKGRSPRVYYMSNWRWGEIFIALCLRNREESISSEKLARLYTVYNYLGPIARLCLNTINLDTSNEFHQTWEQYIGKVDREIVKYVGHGTVQTLNNSVDTMCSHCIALMIPTPSHVNYEIEITTRWIAYRFLEIGNQFSRQKCFELYQQLAGQSKLRGGAGWIFEAYAHDWFNRGGIFFAHELPVQAHPTPLLQFHTDPLTSPIPNYFTTAANLIAQVHISGQPGILSQAIGKYFLPCAHNQASFDGLVFINSNTVVLLQMTVAETHEIKEKGLRDLCRVLPSIIKNLNIVFVIPSDRRDHYSKLQKVPDAMTLEELHHRHIRQFRLVLTDESMRLSHESMQSSYVSMQLSGS